MELPVQTAIRYVQPLREGGSMPAVVDTAEGGLFVVKFRGAGQGAKALIAELIVGLLARAAGLPVPELAAIEILPAFGRSEPDSEIQDILRGSRGVNVGMRYLDGAFNYEDGAAGDLIPAELAARIVWLDAFVTNPDRTARNPNLLIWSRRPWLIDHGAALYFHHDWTNVDAARMVAPFPLIRDHVLLLRAGDLENADAAMAAKLTAAAIDGALAAVPDALFMDETSAGDFDDSDAARARYREVLRTRLAPPRRFAAAAVAAQADRRQHPHASTPRATPTRRRRA
jgi:hypothetical protein